MNAATPVEAGHTAPHVAATAPTFDEPAIALAVTTITGHLGGTFEHERCLQRVVAAFDAGHPSWVRAESDGTHTYAERLRPEQFRIGGGA